MKEVALDEDDGITLAVKNDGKSFRCQVEYQVSDKNGHVVTSGKTQCRVGNGSHNIILKTAAAFSDGLHLADVTLKRNDRVVAWGSGVRNIKKQAKVSSLIVPKKVIKENEQFAVTVQLEGNVPADGRIHLEITDSLGRLVIRKERQADGKQMEFSLALSRVLRTVHTVRAALYVGVKCVANAEQDLLTMPPDWRTWDDYRIVDWGGFHEFPESVLRNRFKILHDLGFSLSIISGQRLPWDDPDLQYGAAFRQNHRAIHNFFNTVVEPFRNRRKVAGARKKYLETKDKKYLIRSPSYSDPAFRSYLKRYLTRKISSWRQYEPFAYCLGDETSYTGISTGIAIDYDFSPHALADFRTWLKTQYETLDALNKEWKTKYADWDTVAPDALNEAKAKRHYASWADHRRFSDITTDDMYGYARNHIRDLDPSCRVIISAPKLPRAYMGLDYSSLTKKWDSLICSGVVSGLVEMQRKFLPGPKAAWLGYGGDPVTQRGYVWRAFLHGYSLCYYSQRCALNPDYTLRPDALACVETANIFRRGLAKLLWNIERQEQIGIHYSQASLHTAFLEEGTVRFRDSGRSWVTAAEDLGYQVEYFKPEEIISGKISRHRVFILPYSIAISRKEASAIKNFVRAGGLLIADCRVGLTNEHANFDKGGMLDDVFGIRHQDTGTDNYNITGGKAAFSKDYRALKLRGKELYVGSGEANLKVTTGKALAKIKGVPIYIVNQYGKGHAVYLNFFMSGYESARLRGGEKPYMGLLRETLRLADMKPPLRILAPGKTMPTIVESCQYNDGPNRYFALVKSGAAGGDPEQLKITFPSSGHLYNMLEGKYIGKTDGTTITLKPGDGRAFALMDYQVKSLGITLADEKPRAGDTLKYNVRIVTQTGKPRFHIVRVELYNPAGKMLRHYSGNIVAPNGETSGEIPLALNEAPGLWSIVVQDVATGTFAKKQFRIR